MTNRIADLRLEQFEVNQQRDALFQSDAFVNKLEEGHTNEVNSEVHDALLQVVDMRRELLDQLNKQLGNQLMMAINLQINQQQLMSVSKNLKSILTQQIFWVNSNRPMDWDWIKAFPQSLKDEFKSMKITVNWQKAWPAVFIAFLAGLPLLLIAGLIHWRLGWLKAYQQKLASAVGSLRNDSQLNTPKSDPYRPDPCAAGVPDYSRGWPDSVDHAAQHQRTAMVVQQKTGDILAGVWPVLEGTGEKRRCRTSLRHAGTADQPLASANCPHQSRIAAYPFLVCGGRTFPAASDG